MPIGSGISAQLGYKAESVFGTAVVVDQFNDFNSESLQLEQTWTEPKGLAAGRLVPLASRMVQTTRSASGPVEMDFSARSMGRLVKQMLGSSATATLVSGVAYEQVHQIGQMTGQSMTLQVGRPQTDGTVKAFTAVGCKFPGWEISSEAGGLVGLSLDVDAKDLLTSQALATATYVANEIFNHTQLSIRLGGTASTASGKVSVAGGTQLATLVNKVSVKGENPMATDRYGTGATKSEQIQNDMQDVTIDLEGEFTSQSELYDVWRAGTVTPVQLTWTGSTITGGNYLLDIIASAAKITNDDLGVDGPDILGQTASLKVLADGTNSPLQIRLVSTDTAL